MVGITDLIARGGAVPDIATPIRQEIQRREERTELDRQIKRQQGLDISAEEDRQLNREIADLELKSERIDLLDERKKRRFDDIAAFTFGITPTVDEAIKTGDTTALERSLVRRLGSLQDRIDAGEDIDIQETTEALQMIRTGGITEFKQIVDETNRVASFRDVKKVTGGATGVIIDRLINEGSADTVADALGLIKGGAGQAAKQIARAGTDIVPSEAALVGASAFQRTRQTLRAEAGEGGPSRADIAEQVKQREKEVERVAERRDKMPKARFALRQLEDTTGFVENIIDQTVALLQENSAVGRVVFKNLPLTDQKTITENMKTIRANVGFDKLQSMRDASPTGGALGQVSELENELLQLTSGSLSQDQTTEIIIQNLINIKDRRVRVLNNQRRLFNEDFSSVLGEDLEQVEESAEINKLNDFTQADEDRFQELRRKAAKGTLQ